MEVDWWARGLGLVGTVIAMGLLWWRMFEWWFARRVRVNVTASMTQFWPAQDPGEFVPVDELRPDGYMVHIRIVNTGRPVTIDSGTAFDAVGLLDSQSGRRYAFVPRAEQLPTRLQPQDALDMMGVPSKKMEQAIKSGARMIPYCRDSEGRIHKGKYDRCFHEEAKALIAEYSEVMHG